MKSKNIPFVVKPRAASLKKLAIPYLIHQTYVSHVVPPRMYASARSWIEKNPTYEYHFYDNERCQGLIEQYFDTDTVAAYEKLPLGAFRADFWRYCCLYIHGGVYADIDTVCRSPLTKLIKEGDSFIVPRGVLHKTFLYNAFICATAKNPITKLMIDTMVRLINNGMVTRDPSVVEVFASVFSAADPSKVNKQTAEIFAIVGPLGLARALNQLLGRESHAAYSVGRLTSQDIEVRVLRFTKRFGVTAGMRRILDTRYEGYFDDQKNSGATHWLSK